MKLIIEENWNNINSSFNDEKNLFIEGICAQHTIKNKNNRYYPKLILEREMDNFIETKVNSGKAVGEYTHPKTPALDPDRISHRYVEIKKINETDYWGKAIVLDTPKGNIIKGLIKGGTKIGVSTRGLGTLIPKNGLIEVQEDYKLLYIDVVIDPSAPDAFINGVMEGVEWIYESESKIIKLAEETKQNIQKSSSKDLEKIQIQEFTKFINLLKNNIL